MPKTSPKVRPGSHLSLATTTRRNPTAAAASARDAMSQGGFLGRRFFTSRHYGKKRRQSPHVFERDPDRRTVWAHLNARRAIAPETEITLRGELDVLLQHRMA